MNLMNMGHELGNVNNKQTDEPFVASFMSLLFVTKLIKLTSVRHRPPPKLSNGVTNGQTGSN